MKKLILLSLTLKICCFYSLSQSLKTEFTGSLESINVVVMKLSDSAIIQSSETDEIRINSFLLTKGSTYGWKFPAKRPEFSIVSRIQHDTLFIGTPERFSPKIIGIDTYSETIENLLQVPKSKKIIVSRAFSLKIEGEFNIVEVQNSNSIILTLNKTMIGDLFCEALESIQVNGKNSSGVYEVNGNGTSKYKLRADHIMLIIK
jgi:hypothetical protein